MEARWSSALGSIGSLGARRPPKMRKQVVFSAVRHALGRTARTWFRIVHFSVQADHVHLLVEADDKTALTRGLMGAEIRIARAVNRVLGKHGRVWGSRSHPKRGCYVSGGSVMD